MDKKILCKKLGKELPALKVPPMPGPKGLEVMNSVSEEAWEMWKHGRCGSHIKPH